MYEIVFDSLNNYITLKTDKLDDAFTTLDALYKTVDSLNDIIVAYIKNTVTGEYEYSIN